MRHSNRGRQGHHRNINISVLSFIHNSGVKSRVAESDRKHDIMLYVPETNSLKSLDFKRKNFSTTFHWFAYLMKIIVIFEII